MPPPVTSDVHATACALIDDVTIGLCRFKGLTVVAPHTAWQLVEEAKQQDAFERFNLDYVAESRLHQLGSEGVLAVKLYSARSREILWAEHFSFTPASSAAAISRAVVAADADAHQPGRARRTRPLRSCPASDRLSLVPCGPAVAHRARSAERTPGAPGVQGRRQPRARFRAGDQRPGAHLPDRMAAAGARRRRPAGRGRAAGGAGHRARRDRCARLSRERHLPSLCAAL